MIGSSTESMGRIPTHWDKKDVNNHANKLLIHQQDAWKNLKDFVSELQIQEMDNENNHGALLMERVRSKMDFLEEYREYASTVNHELTNDSKDGNEKPRG